MKCVRIKSMWATDERAVALHLQVFSLGSHNELGDLDNERTTKVRGNRAACYRERADHLEGIAHAETRACERAQALELAKAYQRIADELVGKKKP